MEHAALCRPTSTAKNLLGQRRIAFARPRESRASAQRRQGLHAFSLKPMGSRFPAWMSDVGGDRGFAPVGPRRGDLPGDISVTAQRARVELTAGRHFLLESAPYIEHTLARMRGRATSKTEGRRERKKRELRERIYQSARKLFLKRGFEGTTVEQIAEAADVAQATFFNHFSGKNAVLAEMTREVSERLQELVAEQIPRRASAQQKIRAFGERAADEIEASLGVARDVLLELLSTSSRPGEAFAYLASAYAPFVEIVAEGQRRGEVRTDHEASFLAEMVVGAFNAAAIQWINDPRYPLAERLRRTGVFIGEAIAPPRSPRRRRRT